MQWGSEKYTVLVGGSEWKISVRNLKGILRENIKTDLRETGHEDVG